MKFARRQETAPATSPIAGATDTPVEVAPRGRPVAAFAGILDGRSLWVAVDACPGTLALRDAAGDVLSLPDDATDDQPAYTAAHLDLTSLTDPATYDVVLVAGGIRKPRAVWTSPLTGQRGLPTLQRTDDGTLQVRTGPAPAAATLTSVTAGRDCLRVAIEGAGSTLAILGEGDVVLASWAVVDGVATITSVELDDVAPQMTRVVTGNGERWLPVTRRDNDLADPGRAAPLPQLYDGDADEPRLRLRWSGQAVLQLRVFAQSQENES